jgi:hypothetical protein
MAWYRSKLRPVNEDFLEHQLFIDRGGQLPLTAQQRVVKSEQFF